MKLINALCFASVWSATLTSIVNAKNVKVLNDNKQVHLDQNDQLDFPDDNLDEDDGQLQRRKVEIIPRQEIESTNASVSLTSLFSSSEFSTFISSTLISSSQIETSSSVLSSSSSTLPSSSSSSSQESSSSSSFVSSSQQPSSSLLPSSTEDLSSESSSSAETTTESTSASEIIATTLSTDTENGKTVTKVITETQTQAPSTDVPVQTDQVTTSSSSASLTTNPPQSTGGGGLSKRDRDIVIGVVVGVGGALILAGLVFAAWRVWGKKRSSSSSDSGRNDKSSLDETTDVFRANINQYHAPSQPVNTASNF